MQEEVFYMGLMISKEFELEKEFLTIDLYYESVLELVKDWFMRGYGNKNMGLLDSINRYISENKDTIKKNLISCYVSETKEWEAE